MVGRPTPCENNTAAGYPCRNVDLLSFLPADELTYTGSGEELNDVWGWTDPVTKTDYAIVGMFGGTSFVELSDPTFPKLVGYLPTHTTPTYWRDVKTYNNHAFIVSEAQSHGMQIYDLTQLATLSSLTSLTVTAHYSDRGLGQAHNVFVNEDTGYAYVVGATMDDKCSRGGLHIVDVRNPTSPVFAGCYAADGYTHDVQCVVYDGPDDRYDGREICFASNENRVVILDVTDKSDVTRLSSLSYPNRGYTHQGWLTEDRRYFLIDDEVDEYMQETRTRTIVADVSDLENPVVVGEHKANNRAIDHNLYVVGDLVYQANYRAGLRVLDVSGVATDGRLVEKAYFDVYPPDDNNQFNGAWGNYPFFKSGVVLVSGVEQGLFVLRVNTIFPDDGGASDDGEEEDDGGEEDDGEDNYFNCNGFVSKLLQNVVKREVVSNFRM